MNTNNPKNLDRILLLTTWVRIVEAGSLSAAAKQLNTTQPTVSRRLQSLEQIFKCKLMLRTTHQLKLTDEGDTCYQYAKQLLEQWSILEDTVGNETSIIKGRLRVRAPHAFGQQQLIKPLMKYLTMYPEMRIDWLLNDTSPDFLADNIDCAIHVGVITNPNVVAKLIGYVPRIIVAAPEVINKHGDINGLGIGAISSWLVKPYLLTGQLVHIAENWQADPLPVYFVYPYSNYYAKRLRLFMEIMTIGIQQMIGIDQNDDHIKM
jgi:DNA-binding transcriptional LysR family regulator